MKITFSECTSLSHIMDLYRYLNPRTTEYFMMGSPTPLLLTLVSYLFFVTYLGPKLMENRKPYNISNIIKIYNCAQVICNFYLVYMSFELLWFTDSYRYNCLEIDYSDTPLARKRLTLMWLGFMSRLLDLLDTVFFVLRKKFTQVSFLHVYHHLLVVFVGWILAKTLPGGQLAFVGSINSFVHGVMYSYYFLSSCSPQNKWNLWWKKYITQLQLFQFFICIVHSILQLCAKNCSYPHFVIYFSITQEAFLFFLFYNFYKNTYWNTDKSKVQ